MVLNYFFEPVVTGKKDKEKEKEKDAIKEERDMTGARSKLAMYLVNYVNEQNIDI